MVKEKKTLLPIGWREWVALPGLQVEAIKAKIDTGAASSSIHVSHLKVLGSAEDIMVCFTVHPNQDSSEPRRVCTAPLLEMRWVKSSNGKREHRPVIRTALEIGDQVWPVDLTLTSRTHMGFRMLIGREALRGRFLVDSGKSFLFRKSPDISVGE